MNWAEHEYMNMGTPNYRSSGVPTFFYGWPVNVRLAYFTVAKQSKYIHTYIIIYLVTLASSAFAGFHEGRVLQNT